MSKFTNTGVEKNKDNLIHDCKALEVLWVNKLIMLQELKENIIQMTNISKEAQHNYGQFGENLYNDDITYLN